MEFEDFKNDCLNSICNRKSFLSKKCETNIKIRKCYDKWLVSKEKDYEKKQKAILRVQKELEEKIERMEAGLELTDFDVDWIKLKEEVSKRDEDCIIWNNILNIQQKMFILDNFWDEYKQLNMNDYAHIESVARRPDLKYDVNNVVLIRRFFHKRLDEYRCIWSGRKITENDRNFYLLLLKEYVNGKN